MVVDFWMKTTTMCFSLLQFPRCRMHTLANFWWENFHKLGRSSGGSSSHRILCANKYDPEGAYSRRWTRRAIYTKAGEKNDSLIGKTMCIRNEIIPETSIESNSNKLETSKVRKSRKTSVRNKIVSESTCTEINTFSVVETARIESDQYYADLAKHATVICFDIETTGFGRERDRIIEFACQDLRGGENSTLQTFINPEREVPNEKIHGISTRMVNKTDVPRMKEFIPILLSYVRSRQIPGGVVVLVAHNARTFDVPFLKSEFKRCSFEIPSDWLFVDTLPLAREAMKAKGSTSRITLQALREHYCIPLIGPAHRALSDVHTLTFVLQRLTFELKKTIIDLIKSAFK